MQTILEHLLQKIEDLVCQTSCVLVALDGRCASGKTTLAAALQAKLNTVFLQPCCNVIHMDHFFLRPEQRTEERLKEPGGNVDHERFLEDVLLPLHNGETFSYRPFDCKTFILQEAIPVKPLPVTIIEGSYSCHPHLREYYDLKLFLTVSPEEQMKRIINRNGNNAWPVFRDKWIPLEEKYFTVCGVEACCDMIFLSE